jgi:hypothetical protein
MFWAAGENWWTNAGYWPYDDTDGRNKAISWAGSNAPHLIDEATDSARHSTLLGSGWSSELAIIDVERQGTEGFTARRQLVHIQPNIWLFIDSFQDTLQRQVRTIWTTDRDISVAEGYVPGSFVLTKSDKDTSMLAYFTNNTATFPYVKIFKGSTEPFAGLVEVEGAVYPAPAFVVEQPSSNSWSLVVSMLNEPSQKSSVLSEEPRMLNWSGAQKWELEIPVKQGDITISRSDNLLSMSNESMSDGSDPQVRSLSIRSDFDVSDSVSMVQQAYLKTANSYPSKFYDLISYRLRATYILIALFVLQEVFFLIIGFVFNQRHRIIINVLRIFSILTWLIIGWWLSEIYFSTIDTTFLQAILGIIKPI